MRYHCRLPLFSLSSAIIVGMFPLLWLPALPSYQWFIGITGSAIFLWLMGKRVSQWLAVVLTSLVWAMLAADHQLMFVAKYEGQTHFISGSVKSVYIQNENQKQYSILFHVKCVDDKSLSFLADFYLVLYPNKTLSVPFLAGQEWRLKVNIRAVHGRLNVGGFDLQRYAMANHQLLEGHIVTQQVITKQFSLRQKLVNNAVAVMNDDETTGILLALVFGERSRMSQQQRQLFQKTGTAHLMAISGLHIMLAFMIGCFLIRLIQFFLPICLIWQSMPLLCGWISAIFYVWLSGVNPPALRAILAISLYLFIRWQRGLWDLWTSWIVIIAILLLFDPLMMLSDSFWLSVFAVGCLIFQSKWLPLPKRFHFYKGKKVIGLIYLQILLFVLLSPIQIFLFHGMSVMSMIANIIAIPLMSLLTVPLSLLALFLNKWSLIAHVVWSLSGLTLKFLITFLSYFEHDWFSIGFNQAIWIMVLWLLGIIFICRLHYQLWKIWLSVVFLLLGWSLWQWKTTVKWQAAMLDVGHGLAVVIFRQQHAIIYDTGMATETFSMAEREIIPFLKWHNLKVDGIIISHQHKDHIGGLDSIRAHYPKSWLKSSNKSIGEPCKQGQSWQWRGLTFEVLWPEEQVDRAENADSCVVRVSDGKYSLLLTGDLEKEQEFELITKYRHQLASTVIQVPHHGSKTSSSAPFLRYVKPVLGLSSNSRYNPWRLPSKRIIDRYQQFGIIWESTAKSGQLTVTFSDKVPKLSGFRQTYPRWYHSWFGREK